MHERQLLGQMEDVFGKRDVGGLFAMSKGWSVFMWDGNSKDYYNGVMVGDANGDNKVNVADIVAIVSKMKGMCDGLLPASRRREQRRSSRRKGHRADPADDHGRVKQGAEVPGTSAPTQSSES